MPMHTVAQGECLNSIAFDSGLLWETIWNHGNNAALREQRKDPNVLFPGDQLYLPDLQTKLTPCATDQRHKFVVKGSKVTIKIRLLDQDVPRAGVPYTLHIDGALSSGETDGDGFVTKTIPANAKAGKLIVGTGAAKDVYQLQLGTLDPIETDSGVGGRLRNLGFVADDLSNAIKAFQQKEGLPVTGTSNSATQNRLKEKFGQ
jgi:Putative peptidoglycan binding domain